MDKSEMERLAILSEEMGEVQHLIGKILRFGYASTHPDTPLVTNKDRLTEEVGDMIGSLILMDIKGDLNYKELFEQATRKLKKLKKYTFHQGEF